MSSIVRQPPTRRADNGDTDRTPPCNLDAEQALLGAALLRPDIIDPLAGTITPDDFYRPAHAHTWEAVLALRAAHHDIDPITVADELRRRGLLETLKSPAELVTWQAQTPAISGAAGYARIVADHALMRRLIGAAAEIATLGYSRPVDIHAAVTDAQGIIGDALIRRRPDAEADADLDTFLAGDDDTYDWIVPGLLERGDRLMVTGGEGGGKTTLIRQFGVHVGAGIHPFTWEDVEPMNVWMLDLENSRRQTRRKMRPLRTKASGRLAAGRLRIHCRPAGVDLCRPGDVSWLHERLAANKPDLFIVGPIYKMGRGDWLSEEVAQQMALALDELRTEHACAVMIEAHQPKAQGASQVRALGPIGSSVWLRWPEFGLNLEVQGREAVVKHWRGGRDERSWPAALVRGGEWPWTPRMEAGPDADASAGVATLEEAKSRVSVLMAEIAPAERSVTQVRRDLKATGRGVRYEQIRPACDELVKDGTVTVRGGVGGVSMYRWVPDEDF